MLKKLERAWKAVWLAVFCQIVRITHRSTPEPEWGRDSCRVLFLRPDRIGDAIVSTGIFREIVERAPNVTLDVLGSPRNEAILRMEPRLSTIHVFDRRRWSDYPRIVRELRARRYDGVIDCMVTAPSMTCLLLMIASGARHRIGIAGRGVDTALTVRVPANSGGRHIIDHLAAFGSVFDIDVAGTDWRPGLTLSSDEIGRAMEAWSAGNGRPDHRVLVNVSAGRPARNWPESRFAAAVEHIRKRLGNPEVVMIGAPSEWTRVERTAAVSRARAVQTPRIGDVAALVATATFLLTPDTSVAHMASALGTPTVAMYLKGTSRMWGLYGSPGESLEVNSATLADLALEPVLAAMDRVLDRAAASGDVGADWPAPPERSAVR